MAEGLFCGAENSNLFVIKPVFSWYFNFVKKSLGDWSDEGTPGYIPNPAVKLVSADGTWGATPWESRSLPRDFFNIN
jgi:hypothetical protein